MNEAYTASNPAFPFPFINYYNNIFKYSIFKAPTELYESNFSRVLCVSAYVCVGGVGVSDNTLHNWNHRQYVKLHNAVVWIYHCSISNTSDQAQSASLAVLVSVGQQHHARAKVHTNTSPLTQLSPVISFSLSLLRTVYWPSLHIRWLTAKQLTPSSGQPPHNQHSS